MSTPAPPPRGKRGSPPPPRENVHGAGHNVARNKHSNNNDGQISQDMHFNPNGAKIKSPSSLLREDPETTIGVKVVVRGELEYSTLLRIDGQFTGKLISQGSLIVGSQGKVTGDIVNIETLLVDGQIVGNINVQNLHLRGYASVFGDISCRSIQIDPTAVVVGDVNVHNHAPTRIDSNGKEITKSTQPASHAENVSGKDSAVGSQKQDSNSASRRTSPRGSIESEADIETARKARAEAKRAKSAKMKEDQAREVEAMKAKLQAMEAEKAKEEAEAKLKNEKEIAEKERADKEAEELENQRQQAAADEAEAGKNMEEVSQKSLEEETTADQPSVAGDDSDPPKEAP
mmetsp:Transcript_16584/g.24953  ORF Transcript_16584/g.24953 Transcript_16584/m.24953 type:complete len:345 (+) Transcript_16584:142-1176(+)|eukprot:CAMPEP_0185017986 /NCGR_PEP_ID=MMETSP1103-20130426/836_1 /TAXON_ID=36769 /ORGANISM="Paraphysomonas bandaiensis, Strain Caron Lab Isolate" /LENGTH=344 /DNA_ID=CAMNT_0027547621 /DNA_START=51 /DNA_END=1085 /DNA_ORIENTATION=+